MEYMLLLTELGWMGALGGRGGLQRLVIGHADQNRAREALLNGISGSAEPGDWSPLLREQLLAYARGIPVDFDEIPLALPAHLTPFQRRVLETTRGVRYGERISYGELAARCGSPRAARAVGSVMASNRIPILIPCHRVIASAGRLGGFSAPQGLRLKETMLALEAEGIRANR